MISHDEILLEIKSMEMKLKYFKKNILKLKNDENYSNTEIIMNNNVMDVEKMKEKYGKNAFKIARSCGFKSVVVWCPNKKKTIRSWVRNNF